MMDVVDTTSWDEITTDGQLSNLLGEPSERVANKDRTRLHEHDRSWLAASRFCLVATAASGGTCDVSPKGDPAGFTHVLDDTTIERIARRVLELQQVMAPAPVLTVEEACLFVRVGSTSSLDRWCAKWAPNARCGNGRYTRAALSRGRDKEALKIVKRRERKAA